MDKYRHRVAVFDEKGNRLYKWWTNFLFSDENNSTVDDKLRPFNAYDVEHSSYIEFDSEADFLVFKLKFS